MRDDLKGLTEKDYWVYGITASDFDHAVDIIRMMINARTKQYKIKEASIKSESPDLAEDILDDIAYYTYTDNQFLWQFSLWRLQGLIEAVITHQLLGGIKLIGLKNKLDKLREHGAYTITDKEYNELIQWGKLRNAISHAPPEQYRPISLIEKDIVEYHSFVKILYLRWEKEKEALKKEISK